MWFKGVKGQMICKARGPEPQEGANQVVGRAWESGVKVWGEVWLTARAGELLAS